MIGYATIDPVAITLISDDQQVHFLIYGTLQILFLQYRYNAKLRSVVPRPIFRIEHQASSLLVLT